VNVCKKEVDEARRARGGEIPRSISGEILGCWTFVCVIIGNETSMGRAKKKGAPWASHGSKLFSQVIEKT